MSDLPSDEFLKRFAPLHLVQACPGILAHQAADIYALWNAWEERLGHACDVPFWGIVWPAARVLASYLLRYRDLVQGKVVLELGCGGAVAAIAASMAGAKRVMANDIDLAALHVADRNAHASGVLMETVSHNYLNGDDLSDAQVIIVADLFYEKTASELLKLRLLEFADRGNTVLIADAGRPFAPRQRVRELMRESIAVSPDVEGVDRRLVKVMRM
jgi:predicted nicotinamide N-methyase